MSDIWMPPPREREEKKHPRDGYVVALYFGMKGRLDEEQVLIEVYETYNIWADENSKGYHYRPYIGPMFTPGEIKTIGRIDAPEEGSQLPPRFVLGQFKDYQWRRLR